MIAFDQSEQQELNHFCHFYLDSILMRAEMSRVALIRITIQLTSTAVHRAKVDTKKDAEHVNFLLYQDLVRFIAKKKVFIH